MIVAISGASGFVGRKLTNYLESKNIGVVALNRADFESNLLYEKINKCDCVVNLAGESIFRRWTNSYKKRILSSRIDTTRQIVECINRSNKPKIFISASAIGYYANDVICDEYEYTQGSDFLADVCRQWEEEALKCEGIHRTVITRFAVVLDKDGGALASLDKSMKFGFATIIGNGKQPFSWIALDDLVRAIEHIILNSDCTGIYNLTSLRPSTNLEFTKTLASTKSLLITFPVPKFVFKIAMGESSILLTEGQYVRPTRLTQRGFKFLHTDIHTYITSLNQS